MQEDSQKNHQKGSSINNHIEIPQFKMALDKIASSFEKSAFLHKEVAERLLERLDLMNIKPQFILDAGCGTGYCTRVLTKKYKKSTITGIDFSKGMLNQAKSSNSFFNKVDYQHADIYQLPFANNYFDLVFSNLTMQWIMEPKKALLELNRVLKPGGILIFSSLGLDTLMELKQSWLRVDQNIHVNHFFDMQQIGDQVYSSNFENTVMDRDIITMTYQTMVGLMKDIKAVGANNFNSRRDKNLFGKTRFQQLKAEYEKLLDSKSKEY